MPLTGNKRLYLILVFVLLSMILSRLVWMQLRSYEVQASLHASVTYQAFVGPDQQSPYFSLPQPIVDQGSDVKEPSLATQLWLSKPYFAVLARQWLRSSTAVTSYIRWHWICLFLTLLAAMFASRFLNSVWLPALLVGAALLSRGAMLARIGALSEHIPLAFLATLWFAASTHFLRSGSFWAFYAAALAIITGTLIDSSFCALALAFPLFLYLNHWSRSPLSTKTPTLTPRKGQLFRPLPLPFLTWLQAWQGQKLLQRLSWGLFVGLVTSNVLWSILVLEWWHIKPRHFVQTLWLPALTHFSSLSQSLAYSQLWLGVQLQPIDMQFLGSTMMIIACAFSKSKGANNKNSGHYKSLSPYPECFRLVLCASFLLLLSSWAEGFVEAALVPYSPILSDDPSKLFHAPSQSLVWMEPVILTLGIIGLCHMLRRKTDKASDLVQRSD